MEFDGPPPPMNDTYFPTTLSADLWTRLEENTVDFSTDLIEWKYKLETEREHMDAHTASQAADVARWMDETDFAIRMLRCVEEAELERHYVNQMVQQQKYGEMVQARRDVLEERINGIKEQLEAKEDNNNSAAKKPKSKKRKNKKKHGKTPETAENK